MRRQEKSRFSKFPLLKGRFKLLNLIGKGDMSEIWLAVDAEYNCYVAVKVHEVLDTVEEEVRNRFIDRCLEVFEQVQAIEHTRTVPQIQRFRIDSCTYATVYVFFFRRISFI